MSSISTAAPEAAQVTRLMETRVGPGKHPSRWTVHLSGETRKLLGLSQPEKQTIEAPKGLGTHVLWNAEARSQTSR